MRGTAGGGGVLNGDELVDRAHRTAVEKGFWEAPSVPEKIALIHTEVDEYEDLVLSLPRRLADTPEEQNTQDAAMEAVSAAALEELADVVLRVADLCGHLGFSLPARALVETRYYADERYQRLQDYPLFLHRAAAKATRAHRTGDAMATEEHLREIVALVSTFSGITHGYRLLEAATERKMEKNLARPRKHGRPY